MTTKTFSDVLDDDLENTFFDTDEFSELVSITRGANTTADVPTLPGPPETRRQPMVEDLMGSHVDRSFDIRVADYQISATAVEPAAGDVLTDADSAQFEVMPVEGTKAFTWVDSAAKVYRVHTKRIVV